MTAPAFSADRLHREDVVEAHLVDRLVTLQGWRERAPEDYDRRLALDPDMVVAFVRATQPDAWARLEGQYPDRARDELLRNLVGRLEATGTLEVLRKGVTIIPGIPVRLCAFQPASRLNADLQREYEANILSVTRQLRYSPKNENAIDVGLFVNGIPVATLELKNTLTGTTWRTAENQYREDRSPTGEPLLTFRRGALVHFALDENHVSMTTRLQNGRTRFLPFNLGRDGGAGNPDIAGDFRIGYLYADQPEGKAIFSREVLLDILGRFMHLNEEEQPDGSVKTAMLWPRFHQLDAVRKLAAHARANGPGQAYLFEHSAGSGKSNTIGWSAHRLISLHDEADRSIFDSVIIVTDRVVLDRQLQKTVATFAQTPGVARAIDGTSAQLKAALEAGARIVISTIHKFSTDRLKELIGQKGKRFFVIIDEAHSSQSGQQATALAEALTRDEIDKRYDVLEEAIRAAQAARGPQANVSYCAFTATPRNVTLERFGTKGADGLPRPFHLYSMRQAIEEGFILDVLRNYMTYHAYYLLEKKIEEDPTFERSRASARVARFARLHETALGQKAEVIVEHFRRHVLRELDGGAKAMVVTSSREHAIRMRQALAKYIAEKGYTEVKALVAFSGEITIDGEEYTEAGMNGFSEAELPRRFDRDGWNVLVVAEKYQTGFDQPKLVAMYVDKKLNGLQAVQTLSRLNRTHPGKERTFVLDFQNTTDDIRDAFKPYFEVTAIEEPTDPNQVYELKDRLFTFGILFDEEITAFAEVFYRRRLKADDRIALAAIVRKTVDRFVALEDDEERQEEFRQLLRSFLRFYAFVAQVVRLDDTSLERLSEYASWLNRMLPPRGHRMGDDVTEDMLKLTAFKLRKTEETDASLKAGDTDTLGPIAEFGAGGFSEDEKRTLSEIIEAFNERHGTEFSAEDFIRFGVAAEQILADEDLAEMLRNNPADVAEQQFSQEFIQRVIRIFQKDSQMRSAFMSDGDARSRITRLFFNKVLRELSDKAA